MLIHREEDLGNLGFWVRFQSFVYVLHAAFKLDNSCHNVLCHVGLRLYKKVEGKFDLIAGLLLFFEFCVDVKKDFWGGVLTRSFAV